MSEFVISRTWVARCVVIISLVSFTVRAVQYILIGSFAPLIFGVVLFATISLALFFDVKSANKVVKLFGLILILHGIIRVILGALLKFAPIDSMHATESTSVLYFAVSVLYFCGGLYLFKHPVISNK